MHTALWAKAACDWRSILRAELEFRSMSKFDWSLLWTYTYDSLLSYNSSPSLKSSQELHKRRTCWCLHLATGWGRICGSIGLALLLKSARLRGCAYTEGYRPKVVRRNQCRRSCFLELRYELKKKVFSKFFSNKYFKKSYIFQQGYADPFSVRIFWARPRTICEFRVRLRKRDCSKKGWDTRVSVPGAFKQDNLHPVKPVSFSKFSKFFTFILEANFCQWR